jgi:murein DD-endopeptidase MepM/ murein hydrolase activator NlpD
MRVSRTGVVALCLGVALLDTSAVVNAAPVTAPAPQAPAVLPTALLTHPVGAVARAPSQLHLPESEGPAKLVPKAALRPRSAHTCKADDLKLAWPLEGAAGTNWVINNYTDLEPGTYYQKDWKGGVSDAAITYDGHQGYDLDVGSFREMDANKVLARAAAAGTVIEVDERHDDRHVSCVSNDWNYVAIAHPNGFVSYYGHMKKGSAKVHVGDVVVVGTALGTVGSSGCSTQAHLHFEVHDCENKWLDPAKVGGMWKALPSLHEVSGILDVMLRVGGMDNNPVFIKDPKPNPTQMHSGQLGIGVSSAVKAGDVVTFLVLNGAAPDVWKWNPTGRYGHYLPSWDVMLKPGPAHIVVWLNGVVKYQTTLMVN